MALVPLDPDLCPSCGLSCEVEMTGQPALLHHGGYGQQVVTTVRYCPCGWHLVHSIASERPPR
jgi:hypothetical protein